MYQHQLINNVSGSNY